MPEAPLIPLGLARGHLEVIEEARLSPCALRSARATRRLPLDPEGRAFDLRTEFQRDRDRVIHSRAFRRLRQKTQVYLPDRDDHLRNRMIHTLEVAGIARTLARCLALNEDLAEAVALAHDLGHCAFGHSGERTLDEILCGKRRVAALDPEVAARCGGFKHNYQSLRVVDRLEKRYRHDGLNLTDQVREGILKHTGVRTGIQYPDFIVEGLRLEEPPHLEAQVVALADEIAQQAHDLDDGLQDGTVDLAAVERLEIVRHVAARVERSGPPVTGRFLRINQTVRGIVHLLVTSVATWTAAGLSEWCTAEKIGSHDDYVQRQGRLPRNLVDLAPPVRGLFGELKKFVHRRIINSHTVNRSDERARRVIAGLFDAYYGNPLLLDDHVLLRFKDQAGGKFLRDTSPAAAGSEVRARYHDNPVFVRLVADHLASMTDTFALAEYERLHDPRPRIH